MKFIIRLLVLSGILLSAGSCTKKLAESIQSGTIPVELDNTVLLVQKFEKRDPMVYDPYFQSDNDSLKEATGFKFAGVDLQAEDSPLKKEHPLIVETNNNLDEYNSELQNSLRKYKSQYIVVSNNDLEKEQFADTDKYRYVLRHKPVLHCYIDPRGETFLSYRYMHYFEDRKTGENLPEIQIFSPEPWKTTKAIVYKINRAEEV